MPLLSILLFHNSSLGFQCTVCEIVKTKLEPEDEAKVKNGKNQARSLHITAGCNASRPVPSLI